jgi:hypothetical protein
MNKRILNVYKSRFIAQSEFKIACSNLHTDDVAIYATLTIEGKEITTVFGYYSDSMTFQTKYLRGREWSEVNDFANIPYDVWAIAQSRLRP